VSGAELAARRTMAAAVLGDFRRLVLGDLDGIPEPEWVSWACRLGHALGDLLAGLDADPDAGKLAEIRAVLAGFDWEFDDRQLALERIERIACE
jgi:hypothetical protein